MVVLLMTLSVAIDGPGISVASILVVRGEIGRWRDGHSVGVCVRSGACVLIFLTVTHSAVTVIYSHVGRGIHGGACGGSGPIVARPGESVGHGHVHPQPSESKGEKKISREINKLFASMLRKTEIHFSRNK